VATGGEVRPGPQISANVDPSEKSLEGKKEGKEKD